MIRFAFKECLNETTVGFVVSTDGEESYEPLFLKWMENRHYKDGNAYFEKFIVDKRIGDEQMRRKNYKWNIQGPLDIGASISIKFTLSDPLTSVRLYVTPTNYTYQHTEEFVLLQVIPNKRVIIYGAHKEGRLTTSSVHTFSNEDLSRRENTMMISVVAEGFECTTNGRFPGLHERPVPGDSAARFKIDQLHAGERHTLHRLTYTRF
ncbi:hypothetical protein ACF0H5_011902 [Mactra antiquata]